MRFVVIGGGCYGTFYTQQLLRAADSGAIPQPEVVVVDHGEQPQVAGELRDERVQVVRADWDDFFDDYFASLRDDSDDQIVPPPFTPHLALGWLMRTLNRAHANWSIEPFQGLPETPFVHQSQNGTLNASHADWLCPVHCIEPEICPHTKDIRYWDMAVTARSFARTLAALGQPVEQVHLFQCLHFTHGVGTYPAISVVRAFQALDALPTETLTLRALIGTVSHCHGTMHLLKRAIGTDTVSPAVHSDITEPAGISLDFNSAK